MSTSIATSANETGETLTAAELADPRNLADLEVFRKACKHAQLHTACPPWSDPVTWEQNRRWRIRMYSEMRALLAPVQKKQQTRALLARAIGFSV